MTHYAASKGGVIALTKALAVEFARSGITVNTIPPSLVDTPMVRSRAARATSPASTSSAHDPARPGRHARRHRRRCAFLCSDDAGYITGQVIGVNGGMYI